MENLSAYKAARFGYKRGRENTREEAHEWLMFKSSASDYYKTFAPFIEGKSMAEFFTVRNEKGLKNVILDVAGNGYPFLDTKEAPHDGALAIGLSDLRVSDELKNRYAQSQVDILAANILEKKTWNRAETWVHEKGNTGFDLIFFRPGAGIKYIGVDSSDQQNLSYNYSANINVLRVLLNRAYDILSPGGELFAEIDPDPTEEQMSAYKGYMNDLQESIPGIKAEVLKNEERANLIVHIKKENKIPNKKV